jgi:hypothetical protein
VAVENWRDVIDSLKLPCLLVFDSYYFSAATLEALGPGTHARPCKFLGAVTKNKLRVCEALEARVSIPGQWDAMDNASSKLILAHYYSPQCKMGRNFVISNAYTKKIGKLDKTEVLVSDDYNALFDK